MLQRQRLLLLGAALGVLALATGRGEVSRSYDEEADSLMQMSFHAATRVRHSVNSIAVNPATDHMADALGVNAADGSVEFTRDQVRAFVKANDQNGDTRIQKHESKAIDELLDAEDYSRQGLWGVSLPDDRWADAP